MALRRFYNVICTRQLLVAIMLLGGTVLNAQNSLPKLVPPSPNAAAFSKYGNIPVSTYTGVPDISVPIYEINIRDIKVPVYLSYHASGIKVSEEASRVGLGWVINCGGVISRTIVNKDDFLADPSAYLSPSNTAPALPSSPKYVYLNPSQRGLDLNYYNTDINANEVKDMEPYVYNTIVDFEPDQFNYNFLGYNGKFVLDRERKAILQKQEKISLEVIGTDATSWKVKTADGYIYMFEAYETYSETSTPGATNQKSAWYLTEIISPQQEHVTFHYLPMQSQTIHPVGSYYESVQPVTLSCSNLPCSPQNPPPPNSVPGKYYSNIYLDRIEWTSGTMKFNMADDRQDVMGDLRLSSVEVFNKGASTPYLQYVLSHDYFVSSSTGAEFPTDVGDRVLKRLKLKSLTKKSPTSIQPEEYFFSYYETLNSEKLPPKNSFARDHWGYYNGKHSNASLIPLYTPIASAVLLQDMIGIMGPQRDTSPDHVRAFTLKDITYPTRGTTTFSYSAHTFDGTASGQQGPVSYATTNHYLYPDSFKGMIKTFELDLTDEYVNATGGTVPVELNAVFRSYGPCKDITANPDVYFELYDANEMRLSRVDLGFGACQTPEETICIYCDRSTNSQSPIFSYKNSYILQPGKYELRMYISGTENRFQDISVNYIWWVDGRKRPQQNSDEIQFSYAGGLRVVRMEDFDPVSNRKYNVRKFDYHYRTNVNGVNVTHSYGRRMAEPSYSYFDISEQQLPLIDPTTGTQMGVEHCPKCIHMFRSSDSSLPLTNSQGLSIGYDKVVEILGENGEFGVIEYEFENRSDITRAYNLEVLGQIIPIRPPMMSGTPYELNGLMKSKTIKRNFAGETVSKIVNEYTSKNAKTWYGLERRVITGSAHENGVLMLLYPAMRSTFPYLYNTTEHSYDIAGNMTVTKTTSFSYDNLQHLQLTKTSTNESNGNNTITEYKYPADYSDADAGAVVLNMKNDAHMHSAIIEKTVKDSPPLGYSKVTHREVTVYSTVGSGILPIEKLNMKLNAPPEASEVQPYVPSAAFSAALYDRLFTLQYNADGNVKNIQRASDTPIAYLWGYGGILPIAEVKNSTAEQAFHTSFEEDGDLFTNAGTNLSKTGDKVRNASSFVFPTAYAPDETKTLMSYWYWQDNQWKFSGHVPFQRTITSPGSRLDEVRAFPKGAQMTTYTHAPLTGITSQTDVNDKTTYYKYDALGRLSLILDHKMNIVKKLEYNYQVR